MTTKLASALAAGALAVGILVGAAGTVLVHDAARPTGMGDMDEMTEMMGMMADGAMMPGASPGTQHGGHHGGDR